MFNSWDLVRPRFWYPMSSLEQSMMEFEQMSDMMMRPRFPFGMQREVLAAPKYMEREEDVDGDGDFFADLPVVARKNKPTAFQLKVVPEVTSAETDEDEVAMKATSNRKVGGANSDTDSSTDMDVNDEKLKQTASKAKDADKSVNSTEVKTKDKRHNKNKKQNKQLRKHSYKVSPTTEQKVVFKTGVQGRTSSYSFSNSSVVDDQGRRVTTTRRRYEDSTGRLKAVHEREIDGKKLRTTWNRQSKKDEGKHESRQSGRVRDTVAANSVRKSANEKGEGPTGY